MIGREIISCFLHLIKPKVIVELVNKIELQILNSAITKRKLLVGFIIIIDVIIFFFHNRRACAERVLTHFFHIEMTHN